MAKKKAPLGSGKRFSELRDKLASQGVDDPDAAAAAIGRKKWGSARMTELARKGKKK